MWGVCLDSNAIQDGLFQTVIQYKRKENGEVVIISPKLHTNWILSMLKNCQHLPNIFMENVFPLVIIPI